MNIMDNRYTLTRAGELSDELISIRRKIHQNPEIGFDLPKTTALVAEKLKAYGIEFKKVGKAGISAVLGNAEAGGKTFLLRADMDALPFEELTGLTFASNNGSGSCQDIKRAGRRAEGKGQADVPALRGRCGRSCRHG